MMLARRIAGTALALLLAAFFGFVGFFKTFAPLSTLAEHHAWTIALPEWLGRLVGITELGAALALLASAIWPRAGRWAAASLIANQACAATVHLARGEAAALPQNLLIVAVCVVVIALAPTRSRSDIDVTA